ncbi:MAG: GWxTD domain-containing protein, partial [Acidobacteria bacterium]|nr:GWxTD domain-containing protein [Acidobacteriota bacterium]
MRKPLPLIGWIALIALSAPLFGRAATSLSPKHRKWLEEEVVYIISNEERKMFLNLGSEGLREQFIEDFWVARDPTPGTPENEYKEEHYRRIEYANAYFGFDVGTDGWRSDRGRTYIQLGEPVQKFRFISHGEVRPIELWFYYQLDHPSLPNAFNVMFYQPDSLTGYKLYSPYIDGPDKLITRTGAENDPMGSYRFLRGINPEIARASMTLLTDEPIDPEGFRPSLASDAMLARIRNLPNDRFTKEALERRRQLKEVVKVRRVYDPAGMEVLTVPLRDTGGEPYVHFLLSFSDLLRDMVAGTGKEKQLTATVSVLVRTPHQQAKEKVFQQSHTNRYVYEDDYSWKQELPVTYEDRLPLAPGEYELDIVFRNEATQALYQQHLRVDVPTPLHEGLRLSPPVVYEEVHPGKTGNAPLPFQLSNLKFVPTLRRTFAANEKLSVFFQIEDPSAGPSSRSTDVLKVEFTIGSLTSRGPRQTATQGISKRDFTSSGTVLHGKTFPLEELPPGSYRLVVKVTDP